MRKLLIAVVVAMVASLAFTSVASAHRLRYGTAKKLAIKLGVQEETRKDVVSWRISGADRLSDHTLEWDYRVTYSTGRECDAGLAVFFSRKSNGKPIIKAEFRDVECRNPS